MVAIAKKTSQVAAHLIIAFSITYAVTGSPLVGGLAILVEPMMNVLLLPFHERAWFVWRRRTSSRFHPSIAIAAEKLSQALLHMAVAFGVMYAATGSLAFGGLAAVLEPLCNVLLLPIHDRFWDKLALPMSSPAALA